MSKVVRDAVTLILSPSQFYAKQAFSARQAPLTFLGVLQRSFTEQQQDREKGIQEATCIHFSPWPAQLAVYQRALALCEHF
jgi:hypothetical protein